MQEMLFNCLMTALQKHLKLDINQFKEKKIKILTLKQMLQRLPIALAQAKVGNTSENLLNEIRQIIYSLYQARESTKNYINELKNF